MNPKHIDMGLTRLTERREALSAELASIETQQAELAVKRAAISEYLALVEKQTEAASRIQKDMANDGRQ